MLDYAVKIVFLIIFITILTLPVVAQESIPEVEPPSVATLEAMVSEMESVANRAEVAAQDAQDAAQAAEETAALAQETLDRATGATDLAFNVLGIFEAFGVIITAVAAVLGFFGFRRFVSVQNEFTNARKEVLAQLEESRKEFDDEFTKARKEFNDEFTKQRTKFADLQTELQEAANERGEITEKALLAQAYIPLGERQYKSQDYSGAISTYQTALDLDSNNPVIHYRLGYVYTQQGDLEQAQYHYEKALSIVGDFAPAMAGLGYVIRRQGEKMDEGIKKKEVMNEAEQLLLRAMDLSPKLVDDDGESWWGVLGGLYRRRGQDDDAIYAYEQATLVTPQSSYGFGNLALLYVKKNQRNKMLTTYVKVEQLALAESTADVNNYWGHADLAASRYALGKDEEAAAALDRAIEIAPEESPYTFDALKETLEDLTKVLDESKVPAIQAAIEKIKVAQLKREEIIARREAERVEDKNVDTEQDESATSAD